MEENIKNLENPQQSLTDFLKFCLYIALQAAVIYCFNSCGHLKGCIATSFVFGLLTMELLRDNNTGTYYRYLLTVILIQIGTLVFSAIKDDGIAFGIITLLLSPILLLTIGLPGGIIAYLILAVIDKIIPLNSFNKLFRNGETPAVHAKFTKFEKGHPKTAKFTTELLQWATNLLYKKNELSKETIKEVSKETLIKILKQLKISMIEENLWSTDKTDQEVIQNHLESFCNNYRTKAIREKQLLLMLIKSNINDEIENEMMIELIRHVKNEQQ